MLGDAAAAIALPSLLQLVLPMVFMLVPVMVLLLVFVMMLLPLLPLLLPNYCRCSRLRAQGVTDRQHITALIRLCNAFAIPLRRLRDCSATRPRSLCDAPAHETATPIRLTALRRLWAGSSADYINRPHRLARLQGVLSTRHTPLRNDQCALPVLLGSGTGDRSYLLVGTGGPVM